jgi:metal-responsive CopG/Arc/MetJ family transcriptional regulator
MTEKTAKGRDLARGERLQVMLDDDELTAVDDFRFAQRMPSRSAAVRELLTRGLAAAGYAINSQRKGGSDGVIWMQKKSNGHTDGA